MVLRFEVEFLLEVKRCVVTTRCILGCRMLVLARLELDAHDLVDLGSLKEGANQHKLDEKDYMKQSTLIQRRAEVEWLPREVSMMLTKPSRGIRIKTMARI